MDAFMVIVYLVFLYLAIQALRLIFADADLVLMWVERFGLKPAVLRGQVVWITGASTGIGEYLAYELSKAGCRLILSARSQDLLENVKKQCLTSGRLKDSDILVLPLDITDVASHESAVKKCLDTFGQIDILVNNAGRSQRAWVVDTELAVDREMIELNVIGQVSLTKCVLPHMVERKKGHIVLTSSLAGKGGFPFSATYCLTKFAVNGWFQSLAYEVAKDNIDVSIVCPGPVYSNLTKIAFTAKSGMVHGADQGNDKQRMPTERCAELMAIAISNRLPEVWISRQPALMFAYVIQYTPSLAHRFMKKYGLSTLKMREGR